MNGPNGAWVGWGLGDIDPKVAVMKAFLKGKFSYASVLDSSNTFDQTMVSVVTQMQKAYGANGTNLIVNGIMNFAWQVRCGFVKPPPVVIPTWQGTGVDMWNDGWPQPAAIAKGIVAAVGAKAVWQPIGVYPASVDSPWMGESVQMGVDEWCRICTGASGPGPFFTSGPIFPIGYSQGAICLSHWWRDEVLNPSGRCSNRVNDVIGAVTLGNPCRSPGVANGNKGAGWAVPPMLDGFVTGGISGPDCLTPAQTPDWFHDFVWLGTDKGASELYTMAPIGTNPWTAEANPGHVGTMIYNIVQNPTFGDVVTVAEALFMPVAMVEEIYNGLVFAIKTNNADHFDYDITPMIAYGVSVVNQFYDDYVASGGSLT